MDDASYKRLLNHKRIVTDLLLGFIAPRRPPHWAAALDFHSLREGATEGISDALRSRLGDLTWSIDRRDQSGRAHTLHLVIEHQSSVHYGMPLRFLNYSNLLYQRRYRDRKNWRKGDTADPVLHVVVYNGERRWDAPLTLAGLLAGRTQDRPAPLAVRYEVVDLVAAKLDAVPRANLLRRVAEVEQSVQAGTLPERVRELGAWLAELAEPGLTRTFDLWLGALAEKWGMALPSIREYEEVRAVLLEKIDRWGQEILERGIKQGIEQGVEQGIERGIEQGVEQGTKQGVEQGIKQGVEQGIEREKALLRHQAERRFGPAAAQRLSAVLAAVTDADRLAEAGEWIVDCATAADFLARVDGSRS